MFEFELQRFDDEGADQGESADVPQEGGEEEPLPEELSGLPEDIARETLAEWKASQSQEGTQSAQETQETQETPKPQTEESVPYARFKEKVDEANRLKAQLAEYQRQMQQQPAQFQPLPAPQPPPLQQPQQPQMRITPEIAKKIEAAITAEAKLMCGLSEKELKELEFADDDDAKLIQWNQSKALARGKVFAAIQQAQFEQRQQAQQAFAAQQQYAAAQQAASQFCNDFAQKELATEPNIQAIQNFAANEFFEQLSPIEKQLVAVSFAHVERQIASPAEMYTVKNYYERAKAAFLAKANGAKRQTQTAAQRAAGLPRSDQLKGGSENTGGKLTVSEIEKLLAGDFTQIDPKKQRQMLGLS